MALDEPSENDEIYDEEKFSVVIEKKLLSELGGVSVEFRDNKWRGSGFVIQPTRKPGGACSC